MNRSTIFKLAYRINDTINTLNKYFYILPLMSVLINLLSRIYNNKFFSIVKFILQFVTILSVLLSVGIIVYFTDFVTPINQTYSIYKDLLEPYMELIKHLWNQIINFIQNIISSTTEPSQSIKNEVESIIKDSTLQIKDEVKAGIKDGIKEVFNEALDSMPEDNTSKYLKSFLIGSGIFFIYLFVLPSNPELISEYNWINQCLIEFKITLKDLILSYLTNSGNPDNGGNPGGTNITSPITPNTELNRFFPIESSNSGSSNATITPNTPKLSNISMNEASVQTTLHGITVGKMVETTNILGDVLALEYQEDIKNGVDKLIHKITD